MQYINLTPRWTELVRTWQVIVADANKCRKPDQMTRFWEHFTQASQAADNYNDLISYLRKEGWDADRLEAAIGEGRSIQELDRNTVKESVK